MSSFETIYRMNYHNTNGVVDLSDATGWKAIEKVLDRQKRNWILDKKGIDNTLSKKKFLYINGQWEVWFEEVNEYSWILEVI